MIYRRSIIKKNATQKQSNESYATIARPKRDRKKKRHEGVKKNRENNDLGEVFHVKS